MVFKPLVAVAGQALPEPTSYSASTQTLVDTTRNVAGKIIGSIIRDSVATVKVSWSYLTIAQWAAINRLFQEGAGGSYINSVNFFDQTAGDFITREMYVSDRGAPLWRRDSQTGELLGWKDCSLTLTEV